jgi:hypothetical protein
MNWFKVQKHAEILRTAAPICPLECPNCGMQQLVDAGERVDELKSGTGRPGVGETGECYIRCENCRKYIYIAWEERSLNIAQPVELHVAPMEEVLDGTRFNDIPLVRTTPASKDEYEDLMALVGDGRMDYSVPDFNTEPAADTGV